MPNVNVNFEAMNLEQKIDRVLTEYNFDRMSFDEAKKELLNLHSVSHTLTLADDNADLIDVTKRYGDKYHIEAVKGNKPDLSMMPLNQRVVYGDGIDYHFRLTKK